jgi:hypothetical protein
VSSGHGDAFVSTGTTDFEVQSVTAPGAIDAMLGPAEAHLRESYSDAKFGQPTTFPATSTAPSRISASWTGTYTNGRPATGTIDCFLIAGTGNALVVYHSWYTNGSDMTDPSNNDFLYMLQAVSNSYTSILLAAG